MKYLVYGMKITGISAVKTLSKLGYEVAYYDQNMDDDVFKQLENFPAKHIRNINQEIKDYDILVKSPGIRNDNDIIRLAIKNKLEILSDLEMAFRLFPDRKFISITGTNGKTTTTKLVEGILNCRTKRAHAIGNIGKGMLWEMLNGDSKDYYIIESSSFQLENTVYFKPHIAAILNITPDHIDWHGSFEKYQNAKRNIFKNLGTDDFLVINGDDNLLNTVDRSINTYVFTTLKDDVQGVFLRNNNIIYKNKKNEIDIIDKDELLLVGKHNLENVMAAICITMLLQVPVKDIQDTLSTFRGVAHRMQFVGEYNGVIYYNDSKGTNVDSSMKAIKSFDGNVILIAGGYDKKVSFKPLVNLFSTHVKHAYFMGETAVQLAEECMQVGFKNFSFRDTMKEAVHDAAKIAQSGDIVLLSPACASWGMYNNFEERGEGFIKRVQIENGIL